MVLLAAACKDGSDGLRQPDAQAGVQAPPGAVRLPAAKVVRYVKLEQLSERSGNPWGSIAELHVIDSTGADVKRKAWLVTADSAAANDPPSNAIDGNPNTLWHSQWQGSEPPPPPHALTVDLGAPVKVSGFRYLPRQDTVGNGTIARYRFYVSADGSSWGEPVASGDFSQTGGPTAEQTVVFAEQTANRAPLAKLPSAQVTAMGQAVSVRVGAEDLDADPLVFSVSGLPTGLVMSPASGLITGTPIIPGDYSVNVAISDGKASEVRASFAWRVDAPATAAGTQKPAPGEVRFVKLEELSEVNGQPWGSIAELDLIDASGARLPRAGWTASADSADTSDKPGNAIDGNPATLWHTQWDQASPPPPHSFIVDLGRAAPVRGFRYLPRQDRSSNGRIARFRFYTSVDGVDWGAPVAEGDFSAMGQAEAEKVVVLR